MLHDRLEGLDPFGLHLDLDAPQLHGSLSAAHDDDRVVERHLGDVDTADPQREGPATGADLQHLAQRARARDGAQAAAHRPFRAEVAHAAGRHDLGHLEALAQAVPLRGVHVLHGDLDVATALARASDEPGTSHAPVVGVEIGVHESPWRLRERGHRAAAFGLDGQRRQGREPPLHGPQVEGVELPLHFDGIGPARHPFDPGARHPDQANAGPAGVSVAPRMPRIPRRVPVVCACVARRAMTAELPSPTEVVQAAGGLVVRRQHGGLEIAVVHRPVHQDWSFPKGKLEEGETFELAALREVEEETGLACRLLRFIGHTEYVDRKGRPKAVAYWVMAAQSGILRSEHRGRRNALGHPRRGRPPPFVPPRQGIGGRSHGC